MIFPDSDPPDGKPIIRIYGLFCPDAERIVYVGKTQFSLKRRLQNHFSQKRGKCKKVQWVQKLILRNKKPKIILLENADAKTWRALEKKWIRDLSLHGILLNENGGGGGGIHGDGEEWIDKFDYYMVKNGYSLPTRKSYKSHVNKLFRMYFVGKPEPKRLNLGNVRAYIDTISNHNTQKVAISSLKVFYKHIINQPKKLFSIKYCYK